MDIYKEIKSRVDITNILEHYGIFPVRGRNIYRCPFHDDSRPSANTHKTKSGFYNFHCFPCGLELDIFDFVGKMENFSGNERQVRWKCAKFINNKFGLGLIGELTYEQKLENQKRDMERKKRQAEKLWWEQYEKSVLNEIAKQLRMWEEIQTATHITRGEYKRGEWEFCDLFFTALKRQDWLNWLYNAICGFDHPECEFDYLYPTDKKQVLEMIKKGEIVIW